KQWSALRSPGRSDATCTTLRGAIVDLIFARAPGDREHVALSWWFKKPKRSLWKQQLQRQKPARQPKSISCLCKGPITWSFASETPGRQRIFIKQRSVFKAWRMRGQKLERKTGRAMSF